MVVQFEYTKEKPLRILFAGDSLMQSLAEGFQRNIGRESPFELTSMAVVSSGFVGALIFMTGPKAFEPFACSGRGGEGI